MNKFVYYLYLFVQWTWGILQSLLGLLLYLKLHACHHFRYKGSYGTLWPYSGGVSLGCFIFVSRMDADILQHEYGHTIQSLVLGPLYLLIIGLPSFIWCKTPYFIRKRQNENISYYKLYTERWADRLGGNPKRY